MKRLIVFLITGVICIFPQMVHAADCSYSEQNRLNGLANNIKADFVVESETKNDKVLTEENELLDISYEVEYFVINIFNFTNDFYLQIKNNINNDKKTYYFKDTKEGSISFRGIDPYKITEYTIEVYSNSSLCDERLIRSFKLNIPKINVYQSYDICNEAKEFYLCQKYLNVDNIDNEMDFLTRVNNYLNSQKISEKNEEDKNIINFFGQILKFIVRYWYFFVGGVLILGTTVSTIVIIKLRRRVI